MHTVCLLAFWASALAFYCIDSFANGQPDELGTGNVAQGKMDPFSINVKDFGAKGDGETDDAAAIQRAANAIYQQPSVREWMVSRYDRCMHDAPHPELIFPEGVYLLRSTVVFDWSTSIRGIGKAVIKQADPSKDILYFKRALRISVESISFDGGQCQLHHWTNNLDTATFYVSNCRFQGAAEAAIQSISYRRKTNQERFKSRSEEHAAGAVQDLNVGPYEIEIENGMPKLTRRDPSSMTIFENSTNTIVMNSEFKGNAQAVNINSDGIIVRDCRIETPYDMPGAAIRVGVKAHLHNLDIKINRNMQLPQVAVMQTGGMLSFTNSTIRTNSENGVCVVKSSANANVPIASAIALRDLKVNATNSEVNAIVSIDEGCMPNMLSMYNVEEIGNGTVSAFKFEKQPSYEELDQNLKNRRCKYLSPEKSYHISFGETSPNIDRTLPLALAAFVEEIPSYAISKFEDFPLPDVDNGPTIYDEGIGGEKTDIAKDDTKALQELFRRAAKFNNAKVVLPPKWIRLSSSIDLPPSVSIFSPGMTLLDSLDDSKPIFNITNADSISLKNIAFRKGRNALDVISNGENDSLVSLENCYFFDTKEASINAKVHAEGKSIPGRLRIRARGGVAYTAILYNGNASLMFFDGFWFSCNPDFPAGQESKSFASIRNLGGGHLQLRDVLGVPCYFRRIPMNLIWAPATKEQCGDFRWIDNYGRLDSLNVRYGGEWGGLTPVYNYGTGSVHIEGGFASIECPRIVSTPVLSDSPSSGIMLLNFALTHFNSPVSLKWRGTNGGIFDMTKPSIISVFPVAKDINKNPRPEDGTSP